MPKIWWESFLAWPVLEVNVPVGARAEGRFVLDCKMVESINITRTAVFKLVIISYDIVCFSILFMFAIQISCLWN